MTQNKAIRRKYDTSVFERYQLSNGIIVWLQRSPILLHEGGILIVFLPQVGSQLDPLERPGTAHFFEHIPFQGTRKKPDPEAISGPITQLGGSLSGTTAMTWTKYFIQDLPSEQLELAAETLLSLSIEPLIDSGNVEKERGVILSEYQSKYSSGGAFAQKILTERVFGQNHPLGHLPLGEQEVIESMTAEELQNFHSSHYHSGNIQIVCGGTFSARLDAIEVLEKVFGRLPESPPLSLILIDVTPAEKPESQTLVEPRCGRDLLFLTYFLTPQTRGKEYALRFLAWVLGGTLESSLLLELRQKRGLVYEVGLCQISASRRFLRWSVGLPVASTHFDLAQEVYYEVLRNSDGDLLKKWKVKQQLSRRTDFSAPYYACDSVVEEVADWGYPISYHEDEAYQDAVTVDEVLEWRDCLLNNPPIIFRIKTSD